VGAIPGAKWTSGEAGSAIVSGLRVLRPQVGFRSIREHAPVRLIAMSALFGHSAWTSGYGNSALLVTPSPPNESACPMRNVAGES
jgi:hypothetical protein